MPNLPLITQLEQGLTFKRASIFRQTELTYSDGIFCLSADGQSYFVAKDTFIQQLAKEDGSSTLEPSAMTNLSQRLQIVDLLAKPVDLGMPDEMVRIKGLLEHNGQLIVTYISFYDGTADERNNIVVFRDSSDLANTQLDGPFQLEGGARCAGSMSLIPDIHQPSFGGEIVSTAPTAAIVGRLSSGPSAASFSPSDVSGSGVTDEDTLPVRPADVGEEILTYPLGPTILYNKNLFPDSLVLPENRASDLLIAKNISDSNGDRVVPDLWTIQSSVAYAFTIEESNTYVCIGYVGGTTGIPRFEPSDNVPVAESGIIYKDKRWEYKNGVYSQSEAGGGYDLFVQDDRDAYYWLYDMADIEAIRAGTLEPHDARPYQYGVLNMPTLGSPRTEANVFTASSGHYDPVSKTLYLSQASRFINGYDNYPVVLEFDVDIDVLLGATPPRILDIESPLKVITGNTVTAQVNVTESGTGNTYTYLWTSTNTDIVLVGTDTEQVSYVSPVTTGDLAITLTCEVLGQDGVTTVAESTTVVKTSYSFPEDFDLVATRTVNQGVVNSNQSDFEVLLSGATLSANSDRLLALLSSNGDNVRLSLDTEGLQQLPLDLADYVEGDINSLSIRTKIDLLESSDVSVSVWVGPKDAPSNELDVNYGRVAAYSDNMEMALNLREKEGGNKSALDAVGNHTPTYIGFSPRTGEQLSQTFMTNVPAGFADGLNIGNNPMALNTGFTMTTVIIREQFGSLFGGDNSSIPADRRLYWVIVDDSGLSRILVGGVEAAIGTTPLLAGTLYHLAISWDGAHYRGYVNGELDFEVADSTPPLDVTTNTDSPNHVGVQFNSANTYQRPLRADMDEFHVWSGTAKSSDRVKLEYVNKVTPELFWGAYTTVRNQLPDAGASTVSEAIKGQRVALSGEDASDIDGTIVSYLWEDSTIGGSGLIINDPTSVVASFDTLESESASFVEVSLTVTDNEGGIGVSYRGFNLLSSDVTNIITVNEPNQTIEFGDVIPTFTSSIADSNGNPVTGSAVESGDTINTTPTDTTIFERYFDFPGAPRVTRTVTVLAAGSATTSSIVLDLTAPTSGEQIPDGNYSTDFDLATGELIVRRNVTFNGGVSSAIVLDVPVGTSVTYTVSDTENVGQNSGVTA